MGSKRSRVVCLLGLALGTVGCLADGPPGAMVVADAAFDCAATCDGARASAGCFHRDACVEFCSSRIAYASDRVREAFEMCALVNPLCYEREDDCIEGVVEYLEACDDRGIARDECLADSRFRTVRCIEACEAEGADRATCLESCGSF